eukprot:5410084-Amphidinium_carterae.1
MDSLLPSVFQMLMLTVLGHHLIGSKGVKTQDSCMKQTCVQGLIVHSLFKILSNLFTYRYAGAR